MERLPQAATLLLPPPPPSPPSPPFLLPSVLEKKGREGVSAFSHTFILCQIQLFLTTGNQSLGAGPESAKSEFTF